MTQMSVYRLVPNARDDDPSWRRGLNHGEVVVRAMSTGDARALAAHAEIEAISLKVSKATTQVIASAFRDPKLYTVLDDTSGEFSKDGPRAVLRGVFEVPDNYTFTDD